MELFKFASRGELDSVKRLIEQGARVNATNRCKQTALFFATEHGHVETVQYLLDKGASVYVGASPLIAAARNGHYDCAKLLIRHGAAVDRLNMHGESALSVAIKKRHCDIILLLLQHTFLIQTEKGISKMAVQLLQRARPEHADIVDRLVALGVFDVTSKKVFLAAFGFAFTRGSPRLAEKLMMDTSHSVTVHLYPPAAYYCAQRGWCDVLQKLLEKGVKPDTLTENQTPLYVACQFGHVDVVSLLLNSGANPTMPSKSSNSTGLSLPLEIAIHNWNTAVVTVMLDKGVPLMQSGLLIACHGVDASPTSAQQEQATPPPGDVVSTIKLLLEHGASVGVVCEKGETALYRTCRAQLHDVVPILLAAGADVNQATATKCLNPLYAACRLGDEAMIRALLAAGADVKRTNKRNQTCLHAVLNHIRKSTLAISSRTRLNPQNSADVVKTLLQSGVDQNALCSHEKTALYLASQAGREDIVRLLLENGANLNASSTRHPLNVACECGFLAIVELLLQNGADCNTLSMVSVPVRSTREMLLLGLRQRAITASSLPICSAVNNGYTEIARVLLKHGADASKVAGDGRSALNSVTEMLTSFGNKTAEDEPYFSLFKLMLQLGTDVNVRSTSNGQTPLHIASAAGMCNLMQQLLEQGADCNLLTSAGESALQLACKRGHDAAVELLLKSGAQPDVPGTPTPDKTSSMSALAAVVRSDNVTLLKQLLAHGANVNIRCDAGDTMLHLAKSFDAIETLLEAGIDVNAVNDSGHTSLSNRICVKRQMDARIVELLLKYGSNPNIMNTLYHACDKNDLDVVRLLLEYKADPNATVESMGDDVHLMISGGNIFCIPVIPRILQKPSPLCLACRSGNVAMVECLLSSGAAVEFVHTDGKTPLHFAVQQKDTWQSQALQELGALPVVALLLQHKAPVNVFSNDGETPLYLACDHNMIDVVKQLLDSGADANITTAELDKYPLLTACKKQYAAVVSLLLASGADANVCDGTDQTPLKVAAANADLGTVRELLNHGADVNQLEKVSDTALHAALSAQVQLVGLNHRYMDVPRDCRDFHAVATELINHGAGVNLLDSRGRTPLQLATTVPLLDLTRLLLENGADPNLAGELRCMDSDLVLILPLSHAAANGNAELVSMLIRFGANVNNKDIVGYTALHLAINRKYSNALHSTCNRSNTEVTPIVEQLLSAGAEVDSKDKTGSTALYAACEQGILSCVKLLLKHGANPNSADMVDGYPLHAACRRCHHEIVLLLLDHNADVNVRSADKNKTALHYALGHASHATCMYAPVLDVTNLETVHLLLDRGANPNAVSDDGETPLYVACSNGLASTVGKMLDCCATVDDSSGTKLTLNAACRNKHTAVVELLLSRGIDPNVAEMQLASSSSRYAWPLHIAAAGGNLELVRLLLRYGAKVGATDDETNTALHHAVDSSRSTTRSACGSEDDKSSVVVTLLESGADANACNNSLETPMYKAASKGLLNVVENMLKHGGKPNVSSLCRLTACHNGNVELAMLQNGADPNLDSRGALESQNAGMEFPIHVAVRNGYHEMVTLLLNSGADANILNGSGKTVLWVAIEAMQSGDYRSSERLNTLRCLLEHGADVNALSEGQSVLLLLLTHLGVSDMYNRSRKNTIVEVIELAVKYGANLEDKPHNLSERMLEQQQAVAGGTLTALATFGGSHKFPLELFRAGAGIQLVATCCRNLASDSHTMRSVNLCQAAVLAGYRPTDSELQYLRTKAEANTKAKELLRWLNEDRQQVPNLLRQSRMFIRRHLSVARKHASILPAIDSLGLLLPHDVIMYLKFDGVLTEVNFDDVEVPTNATDIAHASPVGQPPMTQNYDHIFRPYVTVAVDYRQYTGYAGLEPYGFYDYYEHDTYDDSCF